MTDRSKEGKTLPCKQLASISSSTECFGLWSDISGVLGSSCGPLCSAFRPRFSLWYKTLQVLNLPIDHACSAWREVLKIYCFTFSADDFTLIKPFTLQTNGFLWSLRFYSSKGKNFLDKRSNPIFMNIFSNSEFWMLFPGFN